MVREIKSHVGHVKGVSFALGELGEYPIELHRAGISCHDRLELEAWRARNEALQGKLMCRVRRMDKDGEALSAWQRFTRNLDHLRSDLHVYDHSRDVSPGVAQARDQTLLHRIAGGGEDDRNCRSGLFEGRDARRG